MNGIGPSSIAVQWITIAVAVAGVLALSLTWDLRAGSRWRPVIRTATVLICVLGTAATAGVWVNRETEAYTTWAALVGRPVAEQPITGQPEAPPTLPPAPTADAEQPATAAPTRNGAAKRGRVVPYKLTGARSGLTLEAYAYLPAAYDDPTQAAVRFPVIEALHGYPGSPTIWTAKLGAPEYLDQEIAAGRMAPTVVLFPYQTPDPKLDTECVDLVNGPKTETFLTVDLPTDAVQRFRVRADRNAWGLIGYSAGGFCAVNLALRHPDRYAAGASLSGWMDAGITIGDGSERTHNNPLWRLQNLPPPPVALYLASARDDAHTMRDMAKLVAVAKPPVSVDTALVRTGGHTRPVWRALSGPAFAWLSARLARPVVPAP